MLARVLTIVAVAAVVFAGTPSRADMPPPEEQGKPAPVPLPHPDDAVPKPVAPQPQPPRPGPQKDAAAPFVAIGFAAMFGLLWLGLRSRGRPA